MGRSPSSAAGELVVGVGDRLEVVPGVVVAACSAAAAVHRAAGREDLDALQVDGLECAHAASFPRFGSSSRSTSSRRKR